MKKVICSQCKSEINADDVICMHCGCPNLPQDEIDKTNEIDDIKRMSTKETDEEIKDEKIEETKSEEKNDDVNEEKDEKNDNNEKDEIEEEKEENTETEKEKVEEEKPKKTRKRRTTKKELEENKAEIIDIDRTIELQREVKKIAEILKKESESTNTEDLEEDSLDEVLEDAPKIDLSDEVETKEEKIEETKDTEKETEEDKDIKEESNEEKEPVNEEIKEEIVESKDNQKIANIKDDEEEYDERIESKEEEKTIDTKKELEEEKTEKPEDKEETKDNKDTKEESNEEKEPVKEEIKEEIKEDKPLELKKEIPLEDIIKTEDNKSSIEEKPNNKEEHASLFMEENFLLKASPSELIEEASQLLIKSDSKDEVINELINKYKVNQDLATNYVDIALKMIKTKIDKMTILEPQTNESEKKDESVYIEAAKLFSKETKDLEKIARMLVNQYSELDNDTAIVLADKATRTNKGKIAIILGICLFILLIILIFKFI